jgi:uncharacterized membrane protein (Fun14 family)
MARAAEEELTKYSLSSLTHSLTHSLTYSLTLSLVSVMSTLLFGVRRATSKPMASNLFRYSSRAPVGVTKSATTATASLTHITRRGAKRVGSLLIMSTMGLAYFQLKDSFALSAAGGSGSGSGSGSGELPDPKDLIAKVLEQYQAEISEVGVSGLAGFCSGYCLKRVSQEVAVGIGAVFMLLQTLQHMGYININYKKVNADVTKVLS